MWRRGMVLGFVSAAVVSVGAAFGDEDGAPATPAEPAAPTSAVTRAGMPSLESLSQTRERPLFRPDRRPPALPEAEDEGASSPTVVLPGEAAFAPKLVGVVTGPDLDIALLRPSAGGAVVRLHLDDELEGWKLDRIDARAVVFRRDDREVTIPIRRPPSAHGATEADEVAPEPDADR